MAGAGVGLGLGAAFLVFGMAGDIADHAHAQRIADAAVDGYAGTYVDESHGLRLGLERYGLPGAADAFAESSAAREAAKARRRADLECMTSAVYYEARGESARGQAAVAQVVMNRVKHPAFPKTVCGVVYQGAGRKGCQFSFACDGSMGRRHETLAWERARNVAARALAGAARAEVGAATHFHTTGVSPIWAPQMLRVASVGTHVFYKFAPYRLRPAPVAPPMAPHVVLTSAPIDKIPELKLPAAHEQAIEASLQPATSAAPVEVKVKPATPVATPAAEEARLAPNHQATTPAA